MMGQKHVGVTLKSAEILIAVGSNQPSRAGNARETVGYAIAALAARGAEIVARSRDYRTSAFPAGSGPDFVNTAVAAVWDLPPRAIMDHLHDIEAELDRTRTARWGARTVDLDLIAVADLVLPDAAGHARWRDLPLDRQMTEAPDTLVVPHPRVQDRAFVLVPLADVAPGWVHPVLGETVVDMLAARPPSERADVRALE